MLRQVWARHFLRETAQPPAPGGGVRLRAKDELPPPAAGIESPYDPQARYRNRQAVSWIGYIVHLSETCEEDAVHLLTQAMTTTAAVHEAQCTAAIHQALAERGLPPSEHLVDAAYVDAELLVRSREAWGIDLLGPPRPNATWQTRVEGGYGIERFEVDWERRQIRCPQGKWSTAWCPQLTEAGTPCISVTFRRSDCGPCPARPLCTRAKHRAGPPPEAAAARRVRGAQGGPRAADHRSGPSELCPAGRDRGQPLPGRAGLRATPQPLSRPGQDASAARGHRRRHQPRTPCRLVPGHPARRHPSLTLRSISRLISPTVSGGF